MPTGKTGIKINAKAVTMIVLVLLAFCFNLLGTSSMSTAESSLNSTQTSVTLPASGSINYPVYLGAWLDQVAGGYSTWVNETGKGLAIYASLAALAPQIPVPNNGTFQWTLTDGLKEALPMLQQGLYGALMGLVFSVLKKLQMERVITL
jgi:hypothetical protein